MQADAIQRVSNAIHDVLASALSAANVSGGVFIGPLDDPNASGAALVMFLFRIVPTPDLRSSDHVTVSNDPVPVPVTYRNSLPVDLYYLVAAGDQNVGGEAESLYWIGLALQTLQAQGEGPRVDALPDRELPHLGDLHRLARVDRSGRGAVGGTTREELPHGSAAEPLSQPQCLPSPHLCKPTRSSTPACSRWS
jgi:Pvc16 N-terminal domain